MTAKEKIEVFLATEQIAMAGVSRNPKKFGHETFLDLRQKGLDIIPVNPNTDEIAGTKSYKSVLDLPANISSLLIMTPKKETLGIVTEAIEKGIKNIWIQQMSDTPETLALLEKTEINVITGQCIRMYFNPSGIHKLHFKIMKFFGKLPN